MTQSLKQNLLFTWLKNFFKQDDFVPVARNEYYSRDGDKVVSETEIEYIYSDYSIVIRTGYNSYISIVDQSQVMISLVNPKALPIENLIVIAKKLIEKNRI